MQVDLIDYTHEPERTVCLAARGDYYDGYVGEDEFDEVMESIEPDQHNVEWAEQQLIDDDLITPPESVFDELEPDEADRPGKYGSVMVEELSDYKEREAKKHALLEQLLRRRHFGPWEHVSLTFTVKGVSVSCERQLTRHRHATFDVQSMRYVDFSEIDAIMPASLREDSHVARDEGLVDLDEETRAELREEYEDLVEHAQKFYQHGVDEDMPKEDARFGLGLGTPVNLTMSTNPRSLMHIFDLRGAADAQWEIRELTDAIQAELEDVMPATAHLYDKHGPFANAP